MSTAPVTLLVVEDSPVYAEILQRLLPTLGADLQFASKWVDTADRYVRRFMSLLRSLTEASKVASEELCRRYYELFGLSTASGRLGSAYGPMERSTDSRQTMSALFTLAHAALEGQPACREMV